MLRLLNSPPSARLAGILAVLLALLAAHGGTSQPSAAPASRESSTAVLKALPVNLPGGEGGIGFDDLGFAPALGKLLVPAGRTGNLDLIDPVSRQIVPIGGFSSQRGFEKGHGEGTTSADFGRGLIFATDRTAKKLLVLDPAGGTVLAKADLAGSPDYVRWVAPTGEIWVTQPDRDRIEIFSLPGSGPPVPVHKGFVATPGGPESTAPIPTSGRRPPWRSTSRPASSPPAGRTAARIREASLSTLSAVASSPAAPRAKRSSSTCSTMAPYSTP
jgi:hypothetical protein